MDILSKIVDLFALITSGLSSFVDFILNIPGLIYSIIDIIPDPFYSIILSFLSIIIFIIIVYVVSKLVSLVKGG